jgi:hypothetical protein
MLRPEMQTKEISSKRSWRELASETPAVLSAEKAQHRRVFRKILRGSFEEGRLSWFALTRWHATQGQRME